MYEWHGEPTAELLYAVDRCARRAPKGHEPLLIWSSDVKRERLFITSAWSHKTWPLVLWARQRMKSLGRGMR